MKKIYMYIVALFLLVLPITADAATAVTPLEKVKEYVSNYYVGELKGDLQQAQTIDEVIDMLDPYSDYFTKEELDELNDSINGTNIGIGVQIEAHEKGIFIADVFEGGSAKEAGLTRGDIITHVDDVPLAGLALEQASAKILGPENTAVKITYLNEQGKPVTKTLIRKPFSTPNTASELLYGNIGYIALFSYSEDAVQLVRKEIKRLKDSGATSFIFDLRDNTGGYVPSGEQIIGLFPGARNAYIEESTDGRYVIPAQRQSIQFPANTIVLVNGWSASASEMTAAALKDQKAAVLYGTNTYGKGTMQAFLDLPDGSYLKLTIAEFFGPNGTKIHQKGITPHVETEAALQTAHYDMLRKKFANYKQLKMFSNVPVNKTFTLTLNKAVSTLSANSIELVTLGGQTVPVTTSIKNNKITVTPTQPLQAGAHYLLLVHPTIKGTNAALKKGSYSYITVHD